MTEARGGGERRGRATSAKPERNQVQTIRRAMSEPVSNRLRKEGERPVLNLKKSIIPHGRVSIDRYDCLIAGRQIGFAERQTIDKLVNAPLIRDRCFSRGTLRISRAFASRVESLGGFRLCFRTRFANLSNFFLLAIVYFIYREGKIRPS